MKKFLRFTAFALCLVIICVTLCSCQFLDDKKINRAVYTDNSRSSFTFRDSNYKLLDIIDKRELILITNRYREYETCYVTKSDVPVLLSGVYGNILYFGDNDSKEAPVSVLVYDTNTNSKVVRLFESVQAEDVQAEDVQAEDVQAEDVNDTNEIWTVEKYYVREDKYDEIKDIIDNSPIDRYYMNKYVIENGEPWNSKSEQIVLDEEVTKAINATVKEKNLSKWADINNRIDWYMIRLYPCDKDMIITDSTFKINLITDMKDYYLFYENDVRSFYKADEKNAEVFKRVFDNYDTYSWEYASVEYYQDIESGRFNEYEYEEDYPER